VVLSSKRAPGGLPARCHRRVPHISKVAQTAQPGITQDV